MEIKIFQKRNRQKRPQTITISLNKSPKAQRRIIPKNTRNLTKVTSPSNRFISPKIISNSNLNYRTVQKRHPQIISPVYFIKIQKYSWNSFIAEIDNTVMS